MIFDTLVEFADAETVAVGTGTKVVGSAVNLQAVDVDIGRGMPVHLVITVDTAFTSGGSATVRFQFATDGQDPLAADGTETVHVQTGDIPVANLTQGAIFSLTLPQATLDYEQYAGLQAVVATAALTAGKVNAFLTNNLHSYRAYPEGQN